MATVGIKQRHLAAPGEQGLVFVLAVDLDQVRGQVSQLRKGCGAAVDPGPRSTVRAQGAAQLADATIVEFVLPEPGIRARGIDQLESGAQLRACGAVADHAAVRPQPGQEAECIDQERFAGAGFAGNDRQAGSEFHFGSAGNGEVTD